MEIMKRRSDGENMSIEELRKDMISLTNKFEDVELLELLIELLESLLDITDEQTKIMLEYTEGKEPTIETAKEVIVYAKNHK